MQDPVHPANLKKHLHVTMDVALTKMMYVMMLIIVETTAMKSEDVDYVC